ncbi:MAG: hypothetical protein KF878_09850 [Planctomycetes bacterium]|nr:hypothetical protein [Planctomycetota bacterium]
MAARFEDLNSQLEETVRHLDELGRSSERQARTSKDLEQVQKRQKEEAQGSALASVLGGAGTLAGSAIRAGGVEAASAFGATGDLGVAGSAAFGSMAFKAIDSIRSFNANIPFVGDVNVGNMAVEASGLGSAQRSLLGAQGQAESALLGMARYGVEVSDEALHSVVDEAYEQNQRVERMRGRIAGSLGDLMVERGADTAAEELAKLPDLVERILDEIKKGFAGGGS